MDKPTGDAQAPLRIALLDDYHDLARSFADWSTLEPVEVVAFHRPLSVPDEAATALASFDVIVALRERMAMPAELFDRLPRLKHLVATGKRHAMVDVAAAQARGVVVSICPPAPQQGVGGVVELTWALILAASRNLAAEDRAMREGLWQLGIGQTLGGRTLGVIGLGTLGSGVASIGRAFGMEVLAWSRNLTDARAAEAGATRTSKDDLLTRADVVTLHLVLSPESRGTIGAREIALMKPGALLVNTSRGPLVDEPALVDALQQRRIRAALDVYDAEPLPPDHPLRRCAAALLSPHLGYYTADNVAGYYINAVENLRAWRDGAPIRLASPA